MNEPIYCLMINMESVGFDKYSRNPDFLKFFALGFANQRTGQQLTSLDWIPDFEGSEYPAVALCGANFMIYALPMIEDEQPIVTPSAVQE